ncbi:hypothetical protein EJB05_53962, partial [Eragrostis curvula]
MLVLSVTVAWTTFKKVDDGGGSQKQQPADSLRKVDDGGGSHKQQPSKSLKKADDGRASQNQQPGKSLKKVDDGGASQKPQPARSLNKVDIVSSQKQQSNKSSPKVNDPPLSDNLQVTKTSQKEAVQSSQIKQKGTKTSEKDAGQSSHKQQQGTKTTHKGADQISQKPQQLFKPTQKDAEDTKQKQPTKKAAMVVPKGLTSTNPNFSFGQPLLTLNELEIAGPATTALHGFYMKLPLSKKRSGIMLHFKRSHFHRSLDNEFFNIPFSDIFDLLNYDALDMSILRCFTLHMVKKTREMDLPVGFLDPELMTLSTICVDKSYVVDYVRRVIGKCAKKKCIMFAHNPGEHWVVVAIVPKWNKVFYLDSMRSSARDHSQLKDVLDEAFLSYCNAYGMAKNKLVHVTKFPCHQQPPSSKCGFYAAHHMNLALELLNMDKAEEFEVPTSSLGDDVLDSIRETISSFIMSDVLNVPHFISVCKQAMLGDTDEKRRVCKHYKLPDAFQQPASVNVTY